MELTGKAFEDFGDQCELDYVYFKELSTSLQYELIVEWFNLQGIKIEAEMTNVTDSFIYYINNGFSDDEFETYQQATAAAIKQANKIYNNI